MNAASESVFVDPTRSTRSVVREILLAQLETSSRARTASHLVGSAVALRSFNMSQRQPFDISIRHFHQLGDMGIVVSLRPDLESFANCRTVIAAGLRACLLVEEHYLDDARRIAGTMFSGTVAVEDIVTFVSLRIDSIAGFRVADYTPAMSRFLYEFKRRAIADDRRDFPL